MASVHFSSGARLKTTSIPSATGDWSIGFWVKAPNGYGHGATTQTQFFLGNNEGGSTDVIALNIGDEADTIMAAIIFTGAEGGGYAAVHILTGSDPGWVFVSIEHASGATSYTIRWRREGEKTFSSGTLSDGVQATFPTSPQMILGGNPNPPGGEEADCYIRSFYCKQALLSDYDLLVISQNLDRMPAGADLDWLPLADASIAGNNAGSDPDWTSSGSPSTDSSQPIEVLSGYPVKPQPQAWQWGPALVTPTQKPLLGGAAQYTMTADVGLFVLSGQDVNFVLSQPAGLALSMPRAQQWGPALITPGQKPGTGTMIAPAQYMMQADTGLFTLTGQSTTLTAQRVLTSATGTFTLSGQDALLVPPTRAGAQVQPLPMRQQWGPALITPGQKPGTGVLTAPATYMMQADVGLFTLSGQSAGLTAQRTLTASTGSFTFTGEDAGLVGPIRPGLALSPQPRAQLWGPALITPGQKVGTGVTAAPAVNNYTLTASTGFYTLTGQAVAFGVTMPAAQGAYALTGQTAGLRAARVLRADTGLFTLTGFAATLTAHTTIIPVRGCAIVDPIAQPRLVDVISPLRVFDVVTPLRFVDDVTPRRIVDRLCIVTNPPVPLLDALSIQLRWAHALGVVLRTGQTSIGTVERPGGVQTDLMEFVVNGVVSIPLLEAWAGPGHDVFLVDVSNAVAGSPYASISAPAGQRFKVVITGTAVVGENGYLAARCSPNGSTVFGYSRADALGLGADPDLVMVADYNADAGGIFADYNNGLLSIGNSTAYGAGSPGYARIALGAWIDAVDDFFVYAAHFGGGANFVNAYSDSASAGEGVGFAQLERASGQVLSGRTLRWNGEAKSAVLNGGNPDQTAALVAPQSFTWGNLGPPSGPGDYSPANGLVSNGFVGNVAALGAGNQALMDAWQRRHHA